MVDFSQREINSMKCLNFESGSNIESRILVYGSGFSLRILKKFIIDNGKKFEDKLVTIKKLMNNADKFDERFVLPLDLAYVDGKSIGYVMNYIESRNLETILKKSSVSHSLKIEFLKEVGEILYKCSELRKRYSELSQFYIGDLHSGNFIYNNLTGQLNIVDLDSCKIGDYNPSVIKYLDTSDGISDFKAKYPTDSDGLHIPNENSDLYCYAIMILNYIYNGEIQALTKEEFFTYIDYLSSVGFNKELLDAFTKLYSNDNNINPHHLLESINEFFLPVTDSKEYKRRKFGHN